jgi:hypothetical protein
MRLGEPVPCGTAGASRPDYLGINPGPKEPHMTRTVRKIRETRIVTTTLSLILAGGLLALQTTTAAAVSSSVRLACMGDYFSYCSQHAVGSPALRACMNENGLRLSKRCISALVAAGEVSQTEVSRRAASAR